MVNWYYVQGTQRIGPVEEETLKILFQRNELDLESYVWKKGFANWERIKNISELNFGPSNQQSSLEMVFNFTWKNVRHEDEIFFIKTGYDRNENFNKKLYGPYSWHELKDALLAKRINDKTLVFTPGMDNWVEVGQTPIDQRKENQSAEHLVDEAPLFIIAGTDATPLIALIQAVDKSNCTLLGAGQFQEGMVLFCSLYLGSSLKAKNIKIKIEKYLPREQKITSSIVEITDEANQVLQSYGA